MVEVDRSAMMVVAWVQEAGEIPPEAPPAAIPWVLVGLGLAGAVAAVTLGVALGKESK